ncbi:MAG TPA: acyl-CoA dehydratase activase [Armatimonadota bacterium]|jgi:predicted CoA-substrate-specific enzyme activase
MMVGSSGLVAGLDIGSVAAKAVVWDYRAAQLAGTALQPTGWEPAESGRVVLQAALAEAGATEDSLEALVVTGYGRGLWHGSGVVLTEITCLARGVRAVAPTARTVFDLGGQDTKALVLDDAGALADFAVNDRCAAGTGRFLEMAGQRLGLAASELSESALGASAAVRLSSLCAVFAESEIVGLLAAGVARDQIARGLCEAVAQQVLSLAGRLDYRGPFVLVGGVARSRAVQEALERALGEPVAVPEQPQLIVARGAALLAADSIAGDDRG